MSNRFTGLAEIYARCRPGYPAGAIDYIMSRCDLKPGDRMVDVGCGTGISSRLFAQRGLCVLGLEPNQEMLDQAMRESPPPSDGPLSYQCRSAEDTGAPDGRFDVVLAAQAFHWFNVEKTRAE